MLCWVSGLEGVRSAGKIVIFFLWSFARLAVLVGEYDGLR